MRLVRDVDFCYRQMDSSGNMNMNTIDLYHVLDVMYSIDLFVYEFWHLVGA